MPPIPDPDKKTAAPSPLPAGAAVFAVTVMAHLPALDNGFVNLDDPAFIAENPMIQGLDRARLWQMLTSTHTANWHPLTWLSHALDYQLFALDPRGHHLTALLLHGLNAFLVFLLARRVIAASSPGEHFTAAPPLFGGMAAALLFALHPLRVESVAWIAERKDLLCGFFTLAAYWAYLHYGETRRRFWYLLTLFAFVCALMSKPMAVTLPLALLLLDFWPLRRRDWPSAWREKIPFLALSLADGLLTLHAQQHAGAMAPLRDLGFGERLANAAHNTVFYLLKTVWPEQLLPHYPFPDPLRILSPGFAAAALTIGGISYFTWRRLRAGAPGWITAWTYYLLTLAPVMGLAQTGSSAAADRYTYLPTLGFYLLLGGGMARLWRSGAAANAAGRAVTAGLCIVALTALSAAARRQTAMWADGESLWRPVVAAYPEKLPEAHRLMGNVLREKGRWEEAERELQTAARLNPAHAPTHNNLGLLYYVSRRFPEAEAAFTEALRLAPGYPPALINLGLVQYQTGRPGAAEQSFRAALRREPERADAHNNLGMVHLAAGNRAAAIGEFQAALRNEPGNATVLANLEAARRAAGEGS